VLHRLSEIQQYQKPATRQSAIFSNAHLAAGHSKTKALAMLEVVEFIF